MRIDSQPRYSEMHRVPTTISAKPEFNMNFAIQARQQADALLLKMQPRFLSPGLTAAVTLSIYNHLNRPRVGTTDNGQLPIQLTRQLENLVDAEEKAGALYPRVPHHWVGN